MGDDGAAALDALMRRLADDQRRMEAVTSERHAAFLGELQRIGSVSLDALADVQLAGAPDVQLRPDREVGAGWDRFLDQPLRSLGLQVRGRPFDLEWTAVVDHGIPNADKSTGAMELQVSSGGTPGDTSTTLNACGVGVDFTLTNGATMVRVAPFLPFSFTWHDDSNLWVARNRGELRVFIRRTGGPTVIDDRRSLWNDGTSWYEEHQDSQSDTFTDSTFFFGAPGDSFEVWFAFDSSIDYHHRGGLFDFGSSQASNSLFADLRFIVFEQFAP